MKGEEEDEFFFIARSQASTYFLVKILLVRIEWDIFYPILQFIAKYCRPDGLLYSGSSAQQYPPDQP
jgi:hypothetical protein